MADDPNDWARVAREWSRKHLEPRCDVILSEVFVATNFLTGDVFLDPSVEDRAYPDLPGFLPGTADLVCILSDGTLLVADWKTGGGTGVWEQLLTLAFGLSRSAYLRNPDGSIRKVRVAALYHDPDNGMRPCEWEVTDSELVAHAKAMGFQIADVGVRTEHVQGSHCTQLYCPHLAYCDAVFRDVEAAYLEDKVGKRLPVLSGPVLTDEPATDEEAGVVMARIAAARRQMKYYEAGIRAYVDNGGRAIDGAFEYKKTPTGYRWVKRDG